MIGLLLVILKKILNFKLYFWCQDIFPNTLLVSNVIKKNIFFTILTKLNKFILNNCDKIITISTDMKKTLIYEYQINLEKVKTVQNWPTIKNNFTKKIISKKNNFNFFYIGNIGRMHDESNAMKFLKKINNCCLIISAGAFPPTFFTFLFTHTHCAVPSPPFFPFFYFFSFKVFYKN